MVLTSPRNRAIVELARAGVRPAAIVEHLAPPASVFTVYNVLARARAAGLDLPRFNTNGVAEGVPVAVVTVPAEILAALEAPADRRGVTAGDLARAVLAHVVRDGLVDAVLDDRDGGTPAQGGGRA
jgi:hypothetical protein